ncbi:MAG: hypothetical protein JSR83_07390 [Proteobacteria bacterium]|nr:hypothetical protein [Pseudomonadota bacterium]
MFMNKAVGRLSVLGAVAVTMLNGCANNIPKGSLSYFLPKAETTLTVTQTLTCNATGDALLQVVTFNPSTVYSSDIHRYKTITPSSISSSVSDADVSFTFTDDGRLSGVNTSTTGQGGTIVKNALAVAKVAGLAPAHVPPAMNAKAACTTIGVLAPKTKADGPPPSVTITYVRSFEFDMSTGAIQLKDGDTVGQAFESEFGTTFTSNTYFRALKSNIPKLGFDVAFVKSTKRDAPNWAGGDSTDLVLPLNALAAVHLEIRGLKDDLTGGNREPIWSGEVLVPLTNDADLIKVPIPKPTFFGQRKFSLALAPNGSITKIGYVSTGASDSADALGIIGSAVLASPKELTTAQQAAALQAQADLIFQQQRLANCQAKPESCTK